mmetsp:Transcript_134984/g.288804  ORF Transcript_134984/g.288804 Transcript_134984/m.288804 type:complete len:210 (-) Transcript_134984:1105-1734(-)
MCRGLARLPSSTPPSAALATVVELPVSARRSLATRSSSRTWRNRCNWACCACTWPSKSSLSRRMATPDDRGAAIAGASATRSESTGERQEPPTSSLRRRCWSSAAASSPSAAQPAKLRTEDDAALSATLSLATSSRNNPAPFSAVESCEACRSSSARIHCACPSAVSAACSSCSQRSRHCQSRLQVSCHSRSESIFRAFREPSSCTDAS